jgi:hypothetical protein
MGLLLVRVSKNVSNVDKLAYFVNYANGEVVSA